MKMNCWLMMGLMAATSAIAQNNTNTLPDMPAPAATPAAEMAPAAAPAAPKKAPAKKSKPVAPKKITEPTIALVPGPATVAVSNINVRGQAGMKGEVVAHLFKGDVVTVLTQINLAKHPADEPGQWAKIALPSVVHVWANKKYIDEASKTVSAKKLNLRAGPGENFSVLGTIERGTPVSELESKGSWIKIEPPTNSYAFVAAMYLKQEPPAPAPAPTVAPSAPSEPTPPPTPIAQPIVVAPTPPPAVEAPVLDTNSPPAPRIVAHEGVVREVGSLITPTYYELYDPKSDLNINFLHTTTTNLDFSRYVGMRIIATGQESLDKRWKDIPVLTVDKIDVIDTNAVPRVIYRSPRMSQRH